MAKRSTHIEIGFVSFVAAAALSGCNPFESYHRDWQQCVDRNNVVVEDRLCDQRGSVRGAGVPYYGWLYSRQPYYPGQVITEGYTAPRQNMSVSRASSASISRGGFGSSAHGFGGGE